MKLRLPLFAAAALCGAAITAQVVAQQARGISAPSAARLALASPTSLDKISSDLHAASGAVDVVVQLDRSPLVVANGEDSKRNGSLLSDSSQRGYSSDTRAQQDAVVAQLMSLGGVELARLRVALNAVVIRVDAAKLESIASIPGVVSINGVQDYRMDLSETVPYIGAAPSAVAPYDGSGVKVAVIDSGIDYTHFNLGGDGTDAAYEAAYGTATTDPRNTTRDGLFPTAKVVDGFDFVGERWPNCPLDANGVAIDCRTADEDPDPIDLEGHGTHVADIIAGQSNDGTHKGVAPGAKLVAIKACSAVATSCNGVALLKAVEFALDPNGDGCMSDAVDVINMSLGSSYGQKEDDLSAASANAVRAGVVVVASAGNSADRPYILGSPSSTPGVISVAQTQVPSASAVSVVVNSPAAIARAYNNTATLDWAPVGSGFSGTVAYVGRGCNADAYLADPSGKVALIDRGACNISEKVARASAAGASGILIGLVAAGDAVTFSNGGECPAVPNGTCKPSMVIQQSLSNSIKANIAAPVVVTVNSSVSVALVGSMVGSSSRGPSYSYQAIKPDVGAPGASVSAIAGTGTGVEPFGGTSGAAPMVSGAAAILVQKYPRHSPALIKALLSNTAETNITTNPAVLPGALAPITRIGGGEIRTSRALNALTAAYEEGSRAPSLSFGYRAVSAPLTLEKELKIRNFSRAKRTYSITPSFRYADDAASGAVTISAPSSVTVGARESREIKVRLTIDPSKLPVWNLNGGSLGGNGALLNGLEFDGYVTIKDAADTITVPWHVLPHKAAEVRALARSVKLDATTGEGVLPLANLSGVLPGDVDVFSLTGTSTRIPRSQLPKAGDNFAVIDIGAVGARLVQVGATSFGVQFAISTNGQRSHPAYPAEFDVLIDTTGDDVPDYLMFTAENGTFASTGQTLVFVQKIGATTSSAFFFADADLNSGNMIMTAPLTALGLGAAQVSARIKFAVFAGDNYFTGNFTDSIGDLDDAGKLVDGMTYQLDTPRFFSPGPATGAVAPSSVENVPVFAIDGGDVASPSQTGLLLLYRDAKARLEAQTVLVR